MPLAPGQADGTHNRRIEQVVEQPRRAQVAVLDLLLRARRFWQLYNGQVYAELKQAYDRDGRLLDLYEKCVANG